jgi:hypothetical protein
MVKFRFEPHTSSFLIHFYNLLQMASTSISTFFICSLSSKDGVAVVVVIVIVVVVDVLINKDRLAHADEVTGENTGE